MADHKESSALKGSKADISSSSSLTSLSTREKKLISSSVGRKASTTCSSSSHTRVPLNSSMLRDKEAVSAKHRTSSTAPSSNSSSCNSSPASRRSSLGRINYGIKPPNPEQYLTPLQQKEVTIRHLKSQLKDSESRAQERDLEIEELKCQLERMREDWIEEECHRIEAQLALNEARKEIKQLRQVVDTMKGNLMEKDKGILKYFVDINTQNKKLESLLRNVELAQRGSLDFFFTTSHHPMEDQATEQMADSGLLLNDEMINQTDIEQVFFSTTSPKVPDWNLEVHKTRMTQGKARHTSRGNPDEKAVQTEVDLNDVQDLLCHLLKIHAKGNLQVPTLQEASKIPVIDVTDFSEPIQDGVELGATQCHFTEKKLQPEEELEEEKVLPVGKQYWSRSFFVDLLALVVPALPTVAWLFVTHKSKGLPLYNMGTLIRACCIIGLHTLRHVSPTV